MSFLTGPPSYHLFVDKASCWPEACQADQAVRPASSRDPSASSLPALKLQVCLRVQLVMQVLEIRSGSHTYEASISPSKLSFQSPHP